MVSCLKLHPAVLVTAGFFFICLSQFSEGLALDVLASGLSLIASIVALGHFLKILRRLRFVALAILVVYAWQTPGTSIWPALEAFSPTRDGLILALTPLLRLLCVAAAVAMLRATLSPEAWVSSLYTLSRPLKNLGFPCDRLAVRLRLVLEYTEDRNMDWRALLRDASSAWNESNFRFEIRALSGLERLYIGLFILLTALVVLW